MRGPFDRDALWRGVLLKIVSSSILATEAKALLALRATCATALDGVARAVTFAPRAVAEDDGGLREPLANPGWGRNNQWHLLAAKLREIAPTRPLSVFALRLLVWRARRGR